MRKAVCTGLVAMLMAVPERLQASMADLIEYMLKSTQARGGCWWPGCPCLHGRGCCCLLPVPDGPSASLRPQDEDEGIAVEACEFWTAFCESEIDKDVLRPFLPRVLPVLLNNMVSRAGRLGTCRENRQPTRPARARPGKG